MAEINWRTTGVDRNYGNRVHAPHAGARCVIASPSAVADDAAHDVLTTMHAGLAAGLDPAAALAAAVPAVGPGAPPAPFVCFGTGW